MADPSLVAWVREYVATASHDERVEAFVRRVDAAIVAELPVLGADPVLNAELHASTKAQYQVFLSLLEREKQELLLPPQAVDLALSIARRELDLDVLLKVYRVAADAVWQFFTEIVADVPPDGPDRADVLVYLWGHGGTWINQAVEQLIGVFTAEREALASGTLARRTETVRALLRGEPIAVDHASTDLGHPLRDTQTALVLWSSQAAAEDAVGDLTRTAAALGMAFEAPVLTLVAGRGELWCWLATRGRPDTALLRAVVADVGASVGTSHTGIEGFRRSHREAVEAQRDAVARRTRYAAYAEVALACLLAGNEDAAADLVADELGALAGEGKGLGRIRETVAAFLDAGGNVDLVAQDLVVHKNTVRYRLAQAETLIGHPLSERRTEIGLALRCFERYHRDLPHS